MSNLEQHAVLDAIMTDVGYLALFQSQVLNDHLTFAPTLDHVPKEVVRLMTRWII